MAHFLAMVTCAGSLATAAFAAIRLSVVLRQPWNRGELFDLLYQELRERIEILLARQRDLELPRAPRRIVQMQDRTVVSLVVLIVVSLGIASATALVDSSLGSTTDPPSELANGSGQGSGEDDAFTGPARERHSVPKRKNGKGLCLMRYTDRSTSKPREGGKWWTSCKVGESLATVEDVKETLALPARFGAVRDARTEAVIPAGTRIDYREGITAPQCEEDVAVVDCRGHIYAGTGLQYAFADPPATKTWIVAVECSDEREDRPSAWAPC